MGEPLTQMGAGDSALSVSSSRLDRALTLLESRMSRAPEPGRASEASATMVLGLELEVAHQRHADLQSAAAAASRALGRAMVEVRRALQPEDDSQDELPLGPGLLDLGPESVQDSAQDEADGAKASEPPPEEEPTE